MRIRVICDETPDDSLAVFEIPAGTSGTVSKTYDGIPAGARCTVTELVNGSTSTVQVEVDGSGQTVTVPAGSTQTADLTDTYTSVPGSLTVQKSIGGSAAGHQGEVRIAVDCGAASPALPDFVIPARTNVGTVSRTYSGIPAGSVCTATGDRGRPHAHRRCGRGRQPRDGDDPARRHRDARPDRSLHRRARRARRDEDDRRAGRGRARRDHDRAHL